jgi:hypothetical protein
MKPIITLSILAFLGACVAVPDSGGGKPGGKAGGDTATVCHKGKKTLELPRGAAQAHLDHGDRLGPC